MRLHFTILFFAVALSTTGCVNTAKQMHVSINPAPISEKTATAILYYPSTISQGPLSEFDIYIDDNPVGSLIAEQPLRLELQAVQHSIEGRVTGALSQAITPTFAVGKVYYFKVRREYGTFVDTIHIEPTAPISGYQIISHR